MKKVETLKIGQSFCKKFKATDEVVRAIAAVSGDCNPVHLDDSYAAKTVFGKRIAHGLFCLNGISMILGNYFPGEGTILIKQEFSYKKPVYIDDEIEICVIVQEINVEKEIVQLECVCRNQDDEVVLCGGSKVKWCGEINHG